MIVYDFDVNCRIGAPSRFAKSNRLQIEDFQQG
jgi:hypothetical protein